MAEKKEHKIVAADTKTEVKPKKKTESGKTVTEAKPVGSAKGLRAGAIILWVFAIAFEVLGIMVLMGKLTISFMPSMYQLIAFIVLDLICVIIGSQLWKKANHIDPVSEKNKVKFWLWNNMGVIVCVVAFVPYIILLLKDKDLDKKTKTIAVVAAVIALLIGGVSSYDFNPVSEEQKTDAVETFGDETVYWAPFGKVYHTHEDCQALNQTDTLTAGTVEQAIAANRSRLCAFCAREDGITTVVIDGD